MTNLKGVLILRRKVKNRKGDKRYFAYTAKKTKAINLPLRISRGGIRL